MRADDLQQAKRTIRDFHAASDAATVAELVNTLAEHTTQDYSWIGPHSVILQ